MRLYKNTWAFKIEAKSKERGKRGNPEMSLANKKLSPSTPREAHKVDWSGHWPTAGIRDTLVYVCICTYTCMCITMDNTI